MSGDRRTLGLFQSILRYFKKVRPVDKEKVRELVGIDDVGNKYYIIPAAKSMTGKESRMIEPPKETFVKHDDITNYGMEMEIPIEWNSWLRGMRKNPPSPEEIERNEINKLKMAEKIRKLEMKEAERLAVESGNEVTTSVTEVERSKDNPKRVPFPKYDGVFESIPGVTSHKKKEPND